MTIKLPKTTFIDKILRFFNKPRDIEIGDIEIDNESYKKFGPYVTIKAKSKSLLKTLFGNNSKGDC